MKTKLIFVVLTILLLTQCGVAQDNYRSHYDNGNTKEYNLDLASFDAIDASFGWNVIVTQGNKQSVRIEVSEHLADRIKAEVSGGVLELGIKFKGQYNKIILNRGTVLNAYVTVTDLKKIEGSGGATFDFKTPIRHNGKFEVELSGAADLNRLRLDCSALKVVASGGSDSEIELLGRAELSVDASGGCDVDITGIDAKTCLIDVSGGADIVLVGATGTLIADCSGGSDLKAYKLLSNICNVSCSGASTAYVNVRHELNAKASGASNIYYYGNPERLSKDSSGASSIHKRQSK